MVAAVIWNRLRIDMLLQIDATIQYALGKTKPVLTFDDLKIDSPYNTYKHPGLPPTPISNPGLAALQAAAAPADVDYLYYVARNDGSGRHYFSKDVRAVPCRPAEGSSQRSVTAAHVDTTRPAAGAAAATANVRGRRRRRRAHPRGGTTVTGTTQLIGIIGRPGRALAVAGPPQRGLRGSRPRHGLRAAARAGRGRGRRGEGPRGPRLPRRQRHDPAQGRGRAVPRPGRRRRGARRGRQHHRRRRRPAARLQHRRRRRLATPWSTRAAIRCAAPRVCFSAPEARRERRPSRWRAWASTSPWSTARPRRPSAWRRSRPRPSPVPPAAGCRSSELTRRPGRRAAPSGQRDLAGDGRHAVKSLRL